jgi:hypothetical protein
MSDYYWKFGDGFSIRYGGPEGIRWFKDSGFNVPEREIPISGLGATNPIGMVLEASKVAVLLLQWWEMRKQTLLQTAQFHERRIPWLSDMLLQWGSEIQEGQVRLDTVTYFDREVTRFFDQICKDDLVDVPSTLLLQLERTAHALVRINSVLNSLLERSHPNFIISGEPCPFKYRPFFSFNNKEKDINDYLSDCDKNIISTLEKMAEGLHPFAAAAAAAAAVLIMGPIMSIGSYAFWGFKKMKAAEAKAKEEKRTQEFYAMQALALELRSCRTLLTIASLLPEKQEIVELPESLFAPTLKTKN